MPFVFHGIGTWYYGKKRIHTLKGACEFCGKQTDLASYDTTLFFVVVFVPVIPLGQKRILQECSICRKHRSVSLARWEEARLRDCGDLPEMLSRNPNDRDAIMRAIGLSIAYQDEPLFNHILEASAGRYTRDAAVQYHLGDAYAFFSRWPSAEDAYAASLVVDDNDVIREQLAWALLKQDRPDEARPYLQHVIDESKRESAGSVYFLVKAYQAQGRHEEALEIMDERDQAFPDWANDKPYQQQRKTSTRYRGTDKKIRSATLAGGKEGYREGNWTARLPRWLAAFVVFGGLGLYLGSAVWIGQARKVYLVNGTSQPYTVVVQDASLMLRPNSATPIRVAEGHVQVAFIDARLMLQPVQARIETPFWSRPFTGHTFIINPDRSAILVAEESYSSAINPRVGTPEVLLFGQAFYSMDGIDYEFQSFPGMLQGQRGSEVRKTRVSLASGWAPEVRLSLLQRLEPQEQIKVCQHVLRLDPNDTLLLYWLSARLSPEEAIKLVETRLDDLPIKVEWHRVYQALMERAHPETDLRPRYRKLLAETEGKADALYLLGLADPNLDDGEKLFRLAAAASPPSGHAFFALGYQALCDARFAEANSWFERALPLLTDKSIPQQTHRDALLANGDYDRLLEALQLDAHLPGRQATAAMQRIRVYAVRGEKAMARQQLYEAVQLFPPNGRINAQKQLDAMLCCCEKDVDGYLKAVGDTPSLEAALLRGQLTDAADLASLSNQDASSYHGLVYLEARRSGAKELAENQWTALLADLKNGDRYQKVFGDTLAGRAPQAGRLPRQLPIEPQSKRVLLAVLAQRYPDQALELLTLAKRLDFQRDAISLCLAKFLQQPQK
jgi:tetratricopeptide (TPR) repeat protein